MKLLLVPVFVFATLASFNQAYAETEYFTVADNEYEQKPIFLKQGDEIEYSVSVSGGMNDDVEFMIRYPDGSNDGGGRIYESYNGAFVAQTTGEHIFIFDNTFSLVSNKSVQFSYQITKNSYFVYVEDLPDYAKSYAGNIVYEGTEYWKSEFPKLNFYVAKSRSDADIMIQWVRDFTGMKHIGFHYGGLVEVGLGDSHCGGEWHRYSTDHVQQIMTHELGHAIGLGHSDDPNDIMYPSAQKTQYGTVEREFTLAEKHAQFVQFCLSKDVSAVEYTVSTNDPMYGFDAYVVTSPDALNDWSQGEPFTHYSDNSCYGKGYPKYSGTCEGITSSSGLLIIMDKDSTNPLTGISVTVQEVEYYGNARQTSQTTHTYPPDPPMSGFGSIEEPEKTFQPPPNEASKKTTSEKPTDNKQNPVCGAGTVEKDGLCIPANNEKTSQNQNGGCLIATAAFGTELAPQVQMLREIRDNVLFSTGAGTSFMIGFNEFYYSFSPIVADLERQSPLFNEIIRTTITPMLSTLSILNYVDVDSEQDLLGYGIGIILLNIGMYFVAPAVILIKIKSHLKKK